jgi:hypothetical protein
LLPDDFIFENEDGGFLDTDNYRKRVLHKIARELQLPKLTFQVIRRTIATLAQKKGTIKDVSGCDAALTHRYDYRCLYAGDSGKRSVDDQFHQFGAAKVTGAKPEVFERVGFNRSSRQQSAQAFCARDTK